MSAPTLLTTLFVSLFFVQFFHAAQPSHAIERNCCHDLVLKVADTDEAKADKLYVLGRKYKAKGQRGLAIDSFRSALILNFKHRKALSNYKKLKELSHRDVSQKCLEGGIWGEHYFACDDMLKKMQACISAPARGPMPIFSTFP